MTHPPVRRSGPARPGFGAGLIVILIVLAIILILLFGNFGGSTSYTGQVAAARKQGIEIRNEISTNQLSILIANYRQTNNKLPATPADLDSPGAFKDPWGNEMTFSFREDTGGTTVIYKSNGPDGEPGTEDDVTREDSLPF